MSEKEKKQETKNPAAVPETKFQETKVTATKTVKAVFAEDTFSSMGKFARGRTYEIPEASFAEWEKAGLCKAELCKAE